MFADDAKAALLTQSSEIDAATARAATGSANVISPADATEILNSITSNTEKVKAISPTT